MDWGESKGTLGLVAVAGLLFVAIRLNLFTPSGAAAALERLGELWRQHGSVVLYGMAGLALLGLGVGALRWRNERAYHAEILNRVAEGPTVHLLPRADWKAILPERVQVWKRMADALPHDEHISFELGGNEESLSFYLHGSKEGITAALTQFRSEWPGLFRKPSQTDPAQVKEGWVVWWVELEPSSDEYPVLAVAEDPLRAVLIEVNGVLGQGRGLVQVIVRRNFGLREKLGQKAFSARDEETSSKGVRAIRQQEAKRYEERASLTYLDVTVRTVGLADTRERAQGIARGLSRAIAASFGGRNPVKPVRQGSDAARALRREPAKKMGVWSADDLAYLAHLAGSDLIQLAPRLVTAPARHLPADPEMKLDPQVHQTAFLEE
jgi:hypothetical protein